jgi:hypothetical protein
LLTLPYSGRDDKERGGNREETGREEGTRREQGREERRGIWISKNTDRWHFDYYAKQARKFRNQLFLSLDKFWNYALKNHRFLFLHFIPPKLFVNTCL